MQPKRRYSPRTAQLKTALYLALLCTGLCPALAAKARIEKQTFELDGIERTCYVYAPDSLSSEPSALLLVFHGSGRDGRSVVDPWRRQANEAGFLVAGLDSSNGTSWRIPADGPRPINDLISALSEKYPVDPRRIYLFGHSAGAAFVLRLALLESEYFAAAAVHAGTFREQSDFAFIDMAERQIPIKILIGDRDAYFPLATAKATAAAFDDRNMPLELEVVPGHNHWYYDRARAFNADLWTFLERHTLEVEPRWKQYQY